MKTDNKMKILTRNFQWIDAVFDTSNGAIRDENCNAIRESAIIAIDNDVRSQYVICQNCGSIIRNTAKELEAHKALSDSSAACFECPAMREMGVDLLKRTYTLQEDGTYVSLTKTKCSLACSKGWCSVPIDSDEARERCQYRGCKTATASPIQDIFTKFPGIFDELATADALDPAVWTYVDMGRNYYKFKASSRYNLTVSIHKTGIISHFTYTSRYRQHDFMYSKRYNRFFWIDDYNYTENCSVSQNVQTQLLKIVAAIYNKEN